MNGFNQYVDGAASQQRYGYYDYNFDPVYLVTIGFSQQEVEAYGYIISNFGKFSRAIAANYCGITDMGTLDRMSYMHNICLGKVEINTIDDVSKHRRKLDGKRYRIGIRDLEISGVREVPRVAIVYGIPEGAFAVYNSNKYKGHDMLYKVLNVTSKNIILETSRVPALKYLDEMKIEDVIEIRERKKNADGKSVVQLAVNKNNCRLCNRFMIVASLRRPEFHLGMYTMVCFEGTKVYVFANSLGISESAKYNGNSQRVYDFGLFKHTIQKKIDAVASNMYTRLGCVYNEFEAGNTEYNEIDRDRKDMDVDDEASGDGSDMVIE